MIKELPFKCVTMFYGKKLIKRKKENKMRKTSPQVLICEGIGKMTGSVTKNIKFANAGTEWLQYMLFIFSETLF